MIITYYTTGRTSTVQSAPSIVRDTETLALATAARDIALGYETRAEAEAANVPAAVHTLRVGGLSYRRDATGTALTTADGQAWSPADPVPTVRHYAQALNLNNDDAPAVNALIAEAAARGDREVHINSPVRAMTPINLYGGIVHRFGGPITWAGGAGHAVGIVERGGYEESGTVHGLEILGNADADAGLMLDHCRQWTFHGLKASGFTKAGAWGVLSRGTSDNRGAARNTFISPLLTGCDNLMRFTKNPAVGGTANTGSSFNTVIGGYFGQFGSSEKRFQFGIQNDVGEGNKFVNTRVSAIHEWTKGWDLSDARAQLIGCAADSGPWSAFVYFLAGTETDAINSITVLGTPMLTTPVAWQGSREGTALAVVAQIAADGRQHPATEFRAIAYGAQVIFYRVDGSDNEVVLLASERANIAHTKTAGMVTGSSALNNGLLQAAPYSTYPEVIRTQWNYPRGYGGNREVYGFYLNQGFSGHLFEPEGNGPEHIIFFATENVLRNSTVTNNGATILGYNTIGVDGEWFNCDGYIRANFSTGNVAVSHATQQLRIMNDGPFVSAQMDLRFTPTITTAGAFEIELPQKPGFLYTTRPHDTAGMFFRFPVIVSGLGGAAAGKAIMASVNGATLNANGNPTMQLLIADTSALISSAHMTTGTEVRIRGWGRWPVNRFT